MTDDDLDEIEMAHRARLRAEAEVATLTTLLRLAEASVSLLRGDVDRVRLELRRLRAAEAPGTDDEAFEGTEWRWNGRWEHDTLDVVVWMSTSQDGPWRYWSPQPNGPSIPSRLALDAMRAAVPGSV